MVFTYAQDSEVEIQASPETVRSVFLDFPRYKEWCKWQIEPIGASENKKAIDLQKDDALSVKMNGMAFKPVVIQNSPEGFHWVGSLPYIFTGLHTFTWAPSQKTPGGTTFHQHEDFTGLLSFMMGDWFFKQKNQTNWDEFSNYLKTEAERQSRK